MAPGNLTRYCSAVHSLVVSQFFGLPTFRFCGFRRLDGKASNSSSSAVLDDNVQWALVMVAFEDNVHWAPLAMVALDDSELAPKKKRAGTTPGGMGGLVHRFHHMLSVEQRWLEIWSSLAISGFAHKLAFTSTNISLPDLTRFASCKIDA